ncbi:MAG: response regulator transcription factor [Bacteroidota bacterium]|nr:response regulator transcription factor [Bacteroidota bacterium]
MKLLIIEDEKALANSIREFFHHENHICEMAYTYDEAREKVNLYDYDCVLVDINLPDGNGLDIIKELKENKVDTGIIIISARNTVGDKITGLDLGADDYLTKPFHLTELNARVKSVVRRRSFEGQREILFNEIRIVPDRMEVFIDKNLIDLTRKEYDMLLYFISNKDRVLSKESIAEHLWGDEIDMADSFDFLYTHIKNLRKKIVENGGRDYIQTIYGIGYKFLSSGK